MTRSTVVVEMTLSAPPTACASLSNFPDSVSFPPPAEIRSCPNEPLRLFAAATQNGADTLINFGGGNTLTLQNILIADLDQDDFTFI